MKAPVRTEAQEQADLVKWLQIKGWLFTATAQATPAGHMYAGKWKPAYQTLSKNRSLGVRKGFPDLCVVTGTGRVVFVEMKRSNGVPSDVSEEQRQWINALSAGGITAVVCCGFDEAISALESADSGKGWYGRISVSDIHNDSDSDNKKAISHSKTCQCVTSDSDRTVCQLSRYKSIKVSGFL